MLEVTYLKMSFELVVGSLFCLGVVLVKVWLISFSHLKPKPDSKPSNRNNGLKFVSYHSPAFVDGPIELVLFDKEDALALRVEQSGQIEILGYFCRAQVGVQLICQGFLNELNYCVSRRVPSKHQTT